MYTVFLGVNAKGVYFRQFLQLRRLNEGRFQSLAPESCQLITTHWGASYRTWNILHVGH